MSTHKRRVGRPRKFKLGEIIKYDKGLGVVVAHRLRRTKSEYRIVPVSGGRKRYGRAAWKNSAELKTNGEHSATGSLVTYRANRWLNGELPEGRGCFCECCIHEAIPRKSFSRFTGAMKEEDYAG